MNARPRYDTYVDGRKCHNCGLEPYRHECPVEAEATRTADRPSPEDWSRLLDYLEVNQPADVDNVIAMLEVRAHRKDRR